MPACEMCGKESRLVTAVIEGAKLDVCSNCAKFGEILKTPVKREFKKPEKKKTVFKRTETIQVIVPDFGKRVKQAREKRGIKQEELAKKIAERESLINKIEAGHFTPSLKTARKLEAFLKITLVEQHEEKPRINIEQNKNRDGFTMADFIKVKKIEK